MFIRRSFVIAISFLMAMLIAACGSSSGGSANPTATASSAPAVIHTATATVKGQSETILTDAQGKTLYYFTPDSATKAACTGACAQTWPPLIFTGSGTPASSTSLSGTLSVLTGANGSQVEYNGHLLYIYSGDTASGQTNGEGLFGKWFVATPNLPVQGGSSGGYRGY